MHMRGTQTDTVSMTMSRKREEEKNELGENHDSNGIDGGP